MDYGKRKCLQCGKIFWASYASQVTCGKECQKAREKERQATRDARRIKPDDLDWTNSRLERALWQLTRLADQSLEMDATITKQNMELEAAHAEIKTLKKVLQEAPKENHDKKYRNICANCGHSFKSADREAKYCCEQCADEHASAGIAI